MISKQGLADNWLPRYTGTPVERFGEHVLLTNFSNYVTKFAEMFDCPVYGKDKPMQTATNRDGVTIVNFGIGSPNAATIMDLLIAANVRGALFLGKCGGLKRSTDIGHFILPSAAIRGEGTSNDYLDPAVPALPAFELQKFASEQVHAHGQEYRTGVIYTTNRRVWEWDDGFRERLKKLGVIGIDMETATLFVVGWHNRVPTGALLLVSDLPMVPEGVKTEESDRMVTQNFVDLHLEIGIDTLVDIRTRAEQVKHFRY